MPLGKSTVFKKYIFELFFHAITVFSGYAVTVSNFSELFSYAATVFLPELILHEYFCGRVMALLLLFGLRMLLIGPALLVFWSSGLLSQVLCIGLLVVSLVKLLILYELWAGERLTLEKAHPRYLRPGRPVQALIFGALVVSLLL